MSERRFRPYSDKEVKQICLQAKKEREERLRVVLHVVGSVIKGANERLYAYVSAELITIDWKGLFQNEWTRDELLTLQWLRSMWEEKMCAKTGKQGGLFPRDWEMRQAIFYALAVSERFSFMIHDYFKRQYGTPLEVAPSTKASVTP